MRRHTATLALAAALALAALTIALGTAWFDERTPTGRVSPPLLAGLGGAAAAAGTPLPQGTGAAPAAEPRGRARHGEDPASLLAAADAALARGRLDLAERLCRGLLARRPGLVPARVRLALAWHARGDSARARRMLAAVVAAHPDDQEARYFLAVTCYALGDLDAALLQWRSAAALDPDSTLGHRSLSFVSLLVGGD